MKWIIFSLLACLSVAPIQAQSIKIDKELQSLVDAVVSLRQTDCSKKTVATNAATASLSADEKWTPMDELKDQSNGECLLTKKMARFNLNPIINGILADRVGKNIVPGHYLNGEDSRYNYSIIEKGIKAKKKVKYNFKGRVGEQDFVIIPYNPDLSTNISISIFKGSTNLKPTIQRGNDGCIYLHTNTKLKPTDQITLEIENKSDANIAIAILNHNTRK